MKRFTIPALVLALGCTLMAAPQGNGKGSSTTPTASTTDKTKPKKEKKTKPKKEKKVKDTSKDASKTKTK